MPGAYRRRTVAFGQAVNVNDAETKSLHALDDGGWRCCAGSHHPDVAPNKAATQFLGGVEQHVHDHRRAAEMRDVFLCKSGVDAGGFDAPKADMRPGERRYRPRKAPAVAMEHWQRPEIHGMLRQAPDERIADRIEISAAVMIDDALRIAGGARGIIEGDRIPLIAWHLPC